MNNIILQEAINLTNEYFKDKVDKGGHPYMDHLLFVSNRCYNADAKIVGILHDIIEDTDIAIDRLNKLIGNDLVKSIQIVSRKSNETYSEFINRIIMSDDLVAMEVKYNDLENNMDISRIPNPTEKDKKRVVKYIKSQLKLEIAIINILNNKLKNCPFCGNSELEIIKDSANCFTVECNDCKTSIGYQKTPIIAFEKWNNRI